MHRADWRLPFACVLLAGCAGLPMLSQPQRPMFRDAALSPQRAAETVVVGRSTRAEIEERLGDADRVPFDNGNEVWVYRDRPIRPGQPELVLLFGADGVVKKLRLRAGDGTTR